MTNSRYVIGIDLGTSNCALAYIDTLQHQGQHAPKIFLIRQHLAAHTVQERELLPSFTFIPPLAHDYLREGILLTPSPRLSTELIVGFYARDQLGRLPHRVIHSAKSWLAHPGVDRELPLLPWRSPDVEEDERLSPVEVSAAYLSYLRQLWDQSLGRSPDGRFEHQEVTVTVPASFDEAAQRLTREAMRLAGLPSSARLLEEPQAAFYHFLGMSRAILDTHVQLRVRPLTLLVIDSGGGTTDFSLFTLLPQGDLERVAVSEHLLLGGDNLDLAIAYHLESLLVEALDFSQWSILVSQARALKEQFLDERSVGRAPDHYRITLPPRTSDLFAQVTSVNIASDTLEQLLVEGFFPHCESSDKPARSNVGLRESGLPYASESAITRHLADFISGRCVHAVLFTGGTLKPAIFRSRLLDVLGSWQEGQQPTELPNQEMDKAVALGASRYGLVLRQTSGRIRGGYPHAVYLEILHNKKPTLLCIIPKGSEPGLDYELSDHALVALAGQPVRFQLYSSRVRNEDARGDLLHHRREEDKIVSLPPLQTLLKSEKAGRHTDHEIVLRVRLTETGIVSLSCRDRTSHQEWDLEFNLRRLGILDSKNQSGSASRTLSPSQQEHASTLLLLYFGSTKLAEGRKQNENPTPRKVIAELERILGSRRENWTMEMLRGLWTPLASGITKRVRSVGHEVTFLMLAGFVLRPGYGEDLDEFRMQELWRCMDLGIAHPKEKQVWPQWWIMWRRVAGGLSAEQQRELYYSCKHNLFDQPEALRLIGSLERLPQQEKIQIGDSIVKSIAAQTTSLTPHHFWALERLMARVPAYAGNNTVVSAHHIERWLTLLERLEWRDPKWKTLVSTFAQGCRLTGDKSREISESLRTRVTKKLAQSGADATTLELLKRVVPVSAQDQAQAFGEDLPLGLRLVSQ